MKELDIFIDKFEEKNFQEDIYIGTNSINASKRILIGSSIYIKIKK